MKTEPRETNKETKPGTGNVETNEKVIGTFVTKTVGIRKHKKEWKAKCRLCGESFKNVKELMNTIERTMIYNSAQSVVKVSTRKALLKSINTITVS